MKSILVIEDEEIVRKNLEDLLESEGFKVLSESNGEDAYHTAVMKEPDIILSDINMPGMNGIELLKKLQRNEVTSLIPFIFITAKNEIRDIRAGMTSGADDYITKPFGIDDVLNAVNSRLRKRENYLSVVIEFRNVLMKKVPHELRTPLVGILGLSGIIEENLESLSKDELLEMVEKIRKSGKRLHRRIEKFLVYGELLSQNYLTAGGRNNFEPASGKISEILLLKAKEWERNNDIYIRFEKGTLNISNVEYEIILNELAENSLKFSEKGTGIRITGAPEDNYYITRVIDNGCGLPNTVMSEIELFKQFSEGCTTEGLGFGLAIVKRIISNNNGEFNFESTSGTGTTVEFKIPLSDNQIIKT